jgi:hypothetical protein
MYEAPKPPASTETWDESVERRLAFVESVLRAGHAVGREPGTAPTPPVPAPRSAQESAADAAANPPPTPHPAPVVFPEPVFPATTLPPVKP